jgi:hypothetical protein
MPAPLVVAPVRHALSPREAEALSLAVQELVAQAEAVRAALARVK